MKKKTIIVTIDGPAGTGKSSVSAQLAQQFNLLRIDSGALFRGVAYFITLNNLKPESFEEYVGQINLDFRKDPKTNFNHLFLNDTDIESEIRTEEISQMASKISIFKKIREHILTLQRKISIGRNVIVDGRDIGSVVFPLAELKFYVDASADIRAQRRYLQLPPEERKKTSVEEIKQRIEERDKRDKTREVAPLIIPQGAIYIDTSHLSFAEVTAMMSEKIALELIA